MGMWEPRDAGEVAAARRAARGYRPRRPEMTGPELPPRTYGHLDGREDAVRPGGESDSLEEEDIVEEYEGVRYYLGRRPGMVDEGLELEEVTAESDEASDDMEAGGNAGDGESELDGTGRDADQAEDNKEVAASTEEKPAAEPRKEEQQR